MRISVLRGISGSGKTTWAKQHEGKALVLSTDHYFLVDGEYRFDPMKLGENHRRCFREFAEAVLKSEPWIIVDNTNLSAWEYAPYVVMGEAYGYQVELLTFMVTPEVSLQRKQLVKEDDLHRSYQRFVRESAHMPSRFERIHRVM